MLKLRGSTFLHPATTANHQFCVQPCRGQPIQALDLHMYKALPTHRSSWPRHIATRHTLHAVRPTLPHRPSPCVPPKKRGGGVPTPKKRKKRGGGGCQAARRIPIPHGIQTTARATRDQRMRLCVCVCVCVCACVPFADSVPFGVCASGAPLGCGHCMYLMGRFHHIFNCFPPFRNRCRDTAMLPMPGIPCKVAGVKRNVDMSRNIYHQNDPAPFAT